MLPHQTILILSDVHFAGAAEQTRGASELHVISNPLLRLLVKAYRHFIWRRDPFAYNHLLDRFLEVSGDADFVIGNGDYSCDTAFIGVCDDASCASVQDCIAKLRDRFGSKLRLVLGDHELGKTSLFGGRGGLRLASWNRAQTDLGLEPFWRLDIGNYVLLGVTSSLLALPIFQPEALENEFPAWEALRITHLQQIRDAFASLQPNQKVLLFCHDPTALPFLWRDEPIRVRLNHLEATIIGHLHSNLFLWKSRLLAGMPSIRFLGNSIRRMSTALHEARLWKHFHVTLCPSLGGIELLKDGGYLQLHLDPAARAPLHIHYCRLPLSPRHGWRESA